LRKLSRKKIASKKQKTSDLTENNLNLNQEEKRGIKESILIVGRIANSKSMSIFFELNSCNSPIGNEPKLMTWFLNL